MNSLRLDLALGMAALGLASCTLHAPTAGERVKLTIEIPRPVARSFTATTPNTVDGFSCLGVNVTGAGIGVSAGLPASCAAPGSVYGGALGGLVSASGGTISVTVPSGSQRLIQVFGVVTSDGTCPDVTTTTSATTGPPFELGRQTADIFQATTVTVSNAWDASKPTLAYCPSGSGALWDIALWDQGLWGP